MPLGNILSSLDKDMLRTSLIMPVYNGATTLEKALASVAEQTHPVDEVVVVNDGSTDATSTNIDNWRNRLPLLVVENPQNLGLTHSLQLGVKSATGDLVFRLDADDIWFPEHAETLVSLALAHPRAVLFAARARIFDSTGKPIGVSATVAEEKVRAQLFWDNPLVHSAIAFDKDAYAAVGGYRGPIYAEDYDLWIRLLRYGQLAATDRVSVRYYVFDGSISRIKRKLALRTRLGLQLQAIRAFAERHPFIAARTLPVVLLRQLLNRINLT